MAKQKTIAEQIEEMQEANKKLSEYEKLFDKMCQINFKKSAKEIKKLIENSTENLPAYDNKVTAEKQGQITIYPPG